MDVTRVTVLGAGIMGNGIAQVAAQSGLEVKMRDIEDKFLESGMNTIKQSLGRMVKKEKIAQADADAVVARIKCTADLIEAVKDADVVIEAIPEVMALKVETYKTMDQQCPDHVIFASNTSGMSITELAAATKRADRFVGMHFFNPVPLMQLVEIVRGYSTSEDTIKVIRDLATKMGKESIIVNDTPGFATSRLIGILQNEAIHAFAEGIASAEDIDKGMKLGMNHPMGPLELADFVGLDTLLHVMENLHNEYGDPKYRPPLLLRQMVRAGHLGRKTGKGFYDYTNR
ncbi:MAG: 3-hydroxyacyl-CoA dehydrogenase NAD-binding domain-containing protein [Dehalococcoidia bacterium]|nr:3-hydroxyacyl-CoA dehydrogenase NAD-binding domain-containing protein [Dehalococcoidia bacterium]